MNKKISFPITIIIIVVCAILAGLFIWQYTLIPNIDLFMESKHCIQDSDCSFTQCCGCASRCKKICSENPEAYDCQCVNNQCVPKLSEYEKELMFEAIEKGVYSGYDESRYEGKTKYVINNNEDWQSLWNEVYSIQQPIPLLPTVDFSKDIVIAVFQGIQSSGGYSIEIIKIVEAENSIKVFVRETSPGPSCTVTSALTQPYHIIKISKTDKEVIFKTEKKITVCEE